MVPSCKNENKNLMALKREAGLFSSRGCTRESHSFACRGIWPGSVDALIGF